VCGGALVSRWWLGWVDPGMPTLPAVGSLTASLLVVLLAYGVAGLLNLGVPDSGARYAASSIHPVALARSFWRDQRTLWRDRDGGLSLAVTTLFWGVGATLQFVVLRWAAEGLGLALEQAAYLQGVVAIGVVVGAGLAGRLVPLSGAKRMLGFGVVLGLTMPVMAQVSSLPVALPLLALVGAVGGLLVVPLNALLQHRGVQLLSAGRSIAVQGFNENASILAMLASYAALMAGGVPLKLLMTGFGLAIAAAITRLMWRERARAPTTAGDGSPA
jgi:MFS transporter, LPLT family, lysophospholipid transporter